MNILVIDDDEAILEALQIIIEGLGYRSTVYKSPDRIREKIDKIKPDIIFFDILLSGVNGVGIIKRLKSEKEYKKTPIILLSANNKIAKFLEASGADDYLAKPFSIKEFEGVVEKWRRAKKI